MSHKRYSLVPPSVHRIKQVITRNSGSRHQTALALPPRSPTLFVPIIERQDQLIEIPGPPSRPRNFHPAINSSPERLLTPLTLSKYSWSLQLPDGSPLATRYVEQPANFLSILIESQSWNDLHGSMFSSENTDERALIEIKQILALVRFKLSPQDEESSVSYFCRLESLSKVL